MTIKITETTIVKKEYHVEGIGIFTDPITALHRAYEMKLAVALFDRPWGQLRGTEREYVFGVIEAAKLCPDLVDEVLKDARELFHK